MSEDAKRKLLWHSNAPHAPTGYGQQTALFAPRLKERWDVAVSAFYGLEGNLLRYDGVAVYPGIAGTYGNETIRDHANIHFDGLRNGLVVTLMDVWVLDPAIWSQLNVACWVPIDHQPCPPPIMDFFRASGAIPIAMSKFGRDQLAEFDPLYVPHGIDCKAYRPVDQDKARGLTGLPKDQFIVGMVAANKGNPSRKCFHEAFQAFKILHARHPETKLYLHTEVTGRFDGVNIPELMANVGLSRGDVFFSDQYRTVHFPFPHDVMANIYSSLDVLLAPSAGEGFGIPVIEAQACGVPVIVSDFSAQPELVGAGWKVSGRRVYTPLKSWQFLPDVEDIADGLEQAFRNARMPGVKERARAFAEQYHVDRVLDEFMVPALEEAERRIAAREPVELAAVA